MKGKTTFLAGMALGYVLGSRSGRSSYEKLSASMKDLLAQDSVQNVVESVKEKATTEAADGVHKLVNHVLPSKSAAPDPQHNLGTKTGLSGGKPLDIGPEVSDEFPDDALPGGEGQLWSTQDPAGGHLPSPSS